MIKVRNTPQLAGITILGDYEDLKALYDAISNYCKLYLDHQDNVNAGYCYESILGLCYDLRHAWQGDRGYEALENNAAQLGSMASVLYELPAETENLIEETRSLHTYGNLYFTVEVLYPWAIYYMFTLQAITDDFFKDEWFEDFDYKYDRYQAERDRSLISYFTTLIQQAVISELPAEVTKTVFDYTRIYTKTDYYISYPDMYLEWLCTYWIKAAPTRKDRHDLLPLVVLELSSVYEEDEEELMEELENANAILGEADKSMDKTDTRRDQGDSMAEGTDGGQSQRDSMSGGSDVSRDQGESEPYDTNLHAARFSKMLHEKALACLRMYDACLDQALELFPIPFQPMEEYMDAIHYHVRKHGPFYRKDYDKYLDEKLGSVDWDRLEW